MLEHKLYEEDMESINNLDIPWNQLEGSSILITGGTGLIGSSLVDALIYRNEMKQANIKIWLLGRNTDTVQEKFEKYLKKDYFHFLCQDVCRAINISEPIDYIIHGASKGDPRSFATDPVGVMNANYMGMYQVLQLAKERCVKKVVFLSTGEVYGIQPEPYDDKLQLTDKGIKENDYGYLDILNLRSCYASSKRAAETLCISYSSQYDINVCIARLCHTYGANMLADDNRVIGEFIRNALHHSDIIMKSQGIQRRSYCYVADTVSALLYLLIYGDRGAAYNVANKNSIITIRQLAELIAYNAGTNIIFDIPKEIEAKGYSNIVHAVLDASKLEELGWKPKYDMEEGVRRTIEMLKDKAKLSNT